MTDAQREIGNRQMVTTIKSIARQVGLPGLEEKMMAYVLEHRHFMRKEVFLQMCCELRHG